MSDTAAQRQILHTIRDLIDAALLSDAEAQPCIASILLECVKYVRSGEDYGLIAGEIQYAVRQLGLFV